MGDAVCLTCFGECVCSNRWAHKPDPRDAEVARLKAELAEHRA